MKTTSKMDLKKNHFARPHLKRILPEFFFMTSHLDSHGTTDIKSEMLSSVQTRNGIQRVEYSIRGIAHVQAYRKDDNCKALH